MLQKQIEDEIDKHIELLNEIETKEAWYKNSTTGRELKRRYEYTIEILEHILEKRKEE